MIYLIAPGLCINLLSASAILTAGFVIWWPMNNNDIDPGEPNARSEQ